MMIILKYKTFSFQYTEHLLNHSLIHWPHWVWHLNHSGMKYNCKQDKNIFLEFIILDHDADYHHHDFSEDAVLNEVVPFDWDEDREEIDGDDFEEEGEDGDKNDIDAILDTIIQRMRSLEESNENVRSVKDVVASVMQERNGRVKRDAEDITGAEKRSSSDEIGILSKTLS